MTIHIINNESEFIALKESWNSLIDQMDHGEVFYTWEWNFAYYKKQYKDCKLNIIIIYDSEDKVIAIAPFCFETRDGFRILHPLISLTNQSYLLADYVGIYINKNAHSLRVLEKITDSIVELKDQWDLIEMINFNDRNFYQFYLPTLFEKKGLTVKNYQTSTCPYLLCDEIDEKSTIEHIRIAEKRLKKLQRDHKVEFLIDQPVDKQIWEQMKESRNKLWNLDKETNTLYYFIDYFLGLPDAEKSFEFSYLKVDDQFSCGHFGFKYKEKVYYFVPVQEKRDEHHTGSLLLYKWIGYYKNQGYKVIDFLRGAEKYKFYWTDRSSFNYNFIVHKNDVRFNLYRASNIFKQVVKKFRG